MTTPIDGITVELHPGGRFETLMLGEHGSYRMVAMFTDIVPPERLAWVEPGSGMHTTSTLEDLGDGITAERTHQRRAAGALPPPGAPARLPTTPGEVWAALSH